MPRSIEVNSDSIRMEVDGYESIPYAHSFGECMYMLLLGPAVYGGFGDTPNMFCRVRTPRGERGGMEKAAAISGDSYQLHVHAAEEVHYLGLSLRKSSFNYRLASGLIGGALVICVGLSLLTGHRIIGRLMQRFVGAYSAAVEAGVLHSSALH